MSTAGVFPSPTGLRGAVGRARGTTGGRGGAPTGTTRGRGGVPRGNTNGVGAAAGGMGLEDGLDPAQPGTLGNQVPPSGGTQPAPTGDSAGRGSSNSWGVEPWNRNVSANEVQPSRYDPRNKYPRINNTDGQENCSIVTIASIRRSFDSRSNVTDIEQQLRTMQPPIPFNWGQSGPFEDAEIKRMVMYLDPSAIWVDTNGAPPQHVKSFLQYYQKSGTFGLTFGRTDGSGHVVMGMYNPRQDHITWRDFQSSHIGEDGEQDTMNPTNDTGAVFWYPGTEM
jgi:hypothetical protein